MNKYSIAIIIASLILIIMCTGCNNKTSVSNPNKESSYEELYNKELYLEIPDNAANPQYILIADTIGQVTFKVDEFEYCLRCSKSESDISGIFADYPVTEVISSTEIFSTLNSRQCETINITILSGLNDMGLLATWDIENTHYSLYSENNTQNKDEFVKITKQIVYSIQKLYFPF